jgi:hypothetical protein
MIDWNRHKSAAYAAITFFDEAGKSVGFKRLDRPTQPKTVADAVEAYPNGWPKHMDDELWFSETENSYMRRIEVLPKHKAYFVCDYLQFEAYVKEQEGEKWTHVYNEHEVCRVLTEDPDRFGIIVIDTASNGYIVCEPNEIKPIKPTLTKAQAWDMLKQTPDNIRSLDDALIEITDKYDII